MVFLESEIMEKENEVIMLEYDCAIGNIMDEYMFEASDTDTSSESGIKKLITKVKKKIDEIIEMIKKFFADLKMKHDMKKLNEAIRKAASSNAVAEYGIDADILCKNMSTLVSKSNEVQKSITKYTKDLNSGKINAEQFDTMVNAKLAEIDETANKLEDNKKKAFFKRKTDAKDIAKNAKKVSDKYENACDSLQKTSISEENEMKALSESEPNAAMKGANAQSKVSKKTAIALGAAAGLVILCARVRSVAKYNAKLYEKHSEEVNKACHANTDRSSDAFIKYSNLEFSEHNKFVKAVDAGDNNRMAQSLKRSQKNSDTLSDDIKASEETLKKDLGEIALKYKGKYKSIIPGVKRSRKDPITRWHLGDY